MRDYRDAKTMAKGLRRSLAAMGTELTHSQSLELIAQAFGFDNWNILAAKIEADRPAPAVAEAAGEDKPLRCAFCGKSQHEVTVLIAGPPPAFICDECVSLCDDIVDDNALEKRVRDVAPEADPLANLTDYTAEQLGAYVARVEGRIAESQKALDRLDADGEDLPDWLKQKTPSERAKVRATYERQLERWRKSAAAVSRVLDAR